MNALTINLTEASPRNLRIEFAGSAVSISANDSAPKIAAPDIAVPRRILQSVASGAVVIDHVTGLMWDASTSAVEKTWKEGDAVAKALRLGGFDDWRLPVLDELESIRDITKHNPAIDKSLFGDTRSSGYWTSSPDASAPESYAWIVDFDDGHANLDNRGDRCCVRAVRSLSRASQ